MTMDTLWILGAADPEMERIEALLRQCGQAIAYAMDGHGQRVPPGNAYTRPGAVVCAGQDGRLITPAAKRVYMVECDCGPVIAYGSQIVHIDHHRPGDPGYGRPPSEFMTASSIGQVITELARLGELPNTLTWPRDTYSGVHFRCGRWAAWAGNHQPTPYVEWEIPRDIVLAAAADHCLGAACRGECPGVEPNELAEAR